MCANPDLSSWNRLQYREYFGGVTAMRSDLFKTINGFSNLFYGWGGEDDDLFNRIRDHNITVFRQPASIAKFKMLHHEKVTLISTFSIVFRD